MITLIAFVIAIVVLVSLHELGHFLVARFFGIKVLRFSVGMGEPIWKKTYKGTEWCIAPIPLGGYVKMLDGREGDVAQEDIPYSFDAQPPLKRMAVVAAGPVTNLVLAWLLLAMALLFGVHEFKPVVGTVVPDTVAARSGFESGDKILAINDTQIKTFADAQMQLLLALDDVKVKVEVEQAGQRQIRMIDTEREQVAIDAIQKGHASLGIYAEKLTTTLGFVAKNSAAEAAGLRAQDQILTVNGVEIHSWLTFADMIQRSPGHALEVVYQRDDEIHHTLLRPHSIEIKDQPLMGRAGVGPKADETWQVQNASSYHPNIFEALTLSWHKNLDYGVTTLKFFGRMLIGQASLNHISGPVTIADMAGKTLAMGLQSYLAFLALISLSLGILNLLPIPVLDGGRLLYDGIEWIRGYPLSEKAQDFGMRLGLALLFLLMCVAFFNDFFRLFG